jgi:hypothetical protein
MDGYDPNIIFANINYNSSLVATTVESLTVIRLLCGEAS